MKPDAIHAERGETLKVGFGIKIELWLEERVTVEREVGVTETRGAIGFSGR